MYYVVNCIVVVVADTDDDGGGCWRYCFCVCHRCCPNNPSVIYLLYIQSASLSIPHPEWNGMELNINNYDNT